MLDDITRLAGPYTGAGLKQLSFGFKIFEPTDVYVATSLSGDLDGDTTLEYGSDYSVSMNADQEATPGGFVTLTAPLVDGQIAVIGSAIPYTQEVQLTNFSRFPPEIINTGLDRIVVQIQQIVERLGRAVLVPPTSSITPKGLLSQIFQAAQNAADSAADAAAAKATCEEIRQQIEIYSWDIPHLVDSLRDVENYPYDGFFVVGGYGDAGGNGQNISNRFVKAEGSTTLRTLGERFADVVNVKDFGAKGDGVTDDTEAIQSALDAGTGKSVFIPSGVYLVSQTLVARAGSRVFGSGKVDYWNSNFSYGTVLKTLGAGNPSKWTDIYDGDPSEETPVIVAGGNGVYFDNFSLVTEGAAPWSIGLFFPAVKQCGYSRVTAFGFTNAPIYLDVTWSDKNSLLKGIHPDIESSSMNEFYGQDFFAQAGGGDVAVGVKIQGTTRDPDNYSTEDWIWSYGGASDVVFAKGRCNGIYVDGAMKNGAKAIQGIRFVYVDVRIGSKSKAIYIDRANRVDFVGGYSEATENENQQIHFTSNTGNVNFLFTAYTGIVFYNGESTNSRLYENPVAGSKVCVIGFNGNIVTPNYVISDDVIRPVSDNAYSLGTSSYNFSKINTRLVRSDGTSLDLCLGSTNVLSLLEAAALFNAGNVRPATNEGASLGSSNYRWNISYMRQLGSNGTKVESGYFDNLYTTSGSINTSDSRCKTSVTSASDDLLDVWASVPLHVFQFKDAVEKKGPDAARFHVGVVAQEVEQAFSDKGLDAGRYGLFCHDKWQDEYETVEVVDQEEVLDEEGNVLTPKVSHTEKRLVLSAGDRYGIRYEEALCVEAAYQRRRADKLEERLAALEKRVALLGV